MISERVIERFIHRDHMNSDSAHILPPCASIILFDINNPNTVPSKDVVANFVNNLGLI
jgi:hypothetical protein